MSHSPLFISLQIKAFQLSVYHLYIHNIIKHIFLSAIVKFAYENTGSEKDETNIHTIDIYGWHYWNDPKPRDWRIGEFQF